MEKRLRDALTLGYERMAACSELLDMINVFPVADGDTGTNMKISLAPLHHISNKKPPSVNTLLFSAIGNSGNIASAFFSELLMVHNLSEIPDAVAAGRDKAWKSVADPKPGTMLTIMDEFANILKHYNIHEITMYPLKTIILLENAVHSTYDQLPALKKAGVIDAGALGFFLFIEGLLRSLAATIEEWRPITDIFHNRIHIKRSVTGNTTYDHCINTTLYTNQTEKHKNKAIDSIQIDSIQNEKSIISVCNDRYLKLHLHTDQAGAVRKKLEQHGKIVQWEERPMAHVNNKDSVSIPYYNCNEEVHIMTDAAGSISHDMAKKLGITLLSSYIVMPDTQYPETSIDTHALYNAMNSGIRVKTAQASRFERHQTYQTVLGLYNRIIYLCVGSVYTGNYETALAWKEENDPENRMTVIDTKTASGRLAIIAIASLLHTKHTNDINKLSESIQKIIDESNELIFLNKLKYLADSGRISKTKGFFGDIFHRMPVVRPGYSGVEKIGMLHKKEEQLNFAINYMKKNLKGKESSLILLEYSDNYEWIKQNIEVELRDVFSSSILITQPLSLTAGAHMGPGTWGIAFLPLSLPEKELLAQLYPCD